MISSVILGVISHCGGGGLVCTFENTQKNLHYILYFVTLSVLPTLISTSLTVM